MVYSVSNSKNKKKKKINTSPLAEATFQAFEPFINIFDCGGAWSGGIYHLIAKEEWDLYRRHKRGERNLRYEDGDKFNPFLAVIRNIYSVIHVQKHMVDKETTYYTSGNKGLGLLYLDIDAHHEWQTDEYHAKSVLEKLFPCGYFRASGRGQNGYLKIRYSSIQEFNAIARELEKNLKQLFEHLGILCDIEIKGTITHDGVSGKMAKLPFATKPAWAKRDESDSWDHTQLEKFKNCPIVNIRRVKNIVEKLLPMLDQDRIHQTQEIKQQHQGKLQKSQICKNTAPEIIPTPVIVSVPDVKQSVALVRTKVSEAKSGSDDDAFARNHRDISPFVRVFYKQHHRFPATQETLSWLKVNKLFSGKWEDKQSRRARRVAQILKFKQQTFDAQKLTGEHQLVDLRMGRFHAWVRRHIGSHLTADVTELRSFDPVSMSVATREVKVPARFIETFLVVIDVCLRQDPLNNKAVPTNRVKALWSLVENGSPWNQCYYQGVRDRLNKMGVINIVDRRHKQGKAWRWEMGHYYPRPISQEERKKLKKSRKLVAVTIRNKKKEEVTYRHNTLYQTAGLNTPSCLQDQQIRPPP